MHKTQTDPYQAQQGSGAQDTQKHLGCTWAHDSNSPKSLGAPDAWIRESVSIPRLCPTLGFASSVSPDP